MSHILRNIAIPFGHLRPPILKEKRLHLLLYHQILIDIINIHVSLGAVGCLVAEHNKRNIFSGYNVMVLSEDDDCTHLKMVHFTTQSTIKDLQSGHCWSAGKV